MKETRPLMSQTAEVNANQAIVNDVRAYRGVRTRRIFAFLVDYAIVLALAVPAAIVVAILGLLTLGLGWALYAAAKPLWWRIGVFLGCLAAAFLLHFCWNYLHDSEVAAIIQAVTVALILYPLSIWLVLRGNKLAKADESYSHSTADDALAFVQ